MLSEAEYPLFFLPDYQGRIRLLLSNQLSLGGMPGVPTASYSQPQDHFGGRSGACSLFPSGSSVDMKYWLPLKIFQCPFVTQSQVKSSAKSTGTPILLINNEELLSVVDYTVKKQIKTAAKEKTYHLTEKQEAEHDLTG
ncbi:unnamed protein product [Lepidochelys kempii]